jgi:hypothetical protein
VATASEVERFIDDLAHPLRDVMLEVRRVLLEADPRLSESIKWKSPTFEYKGNLASINPRAKQFVSLMFHTGRKIPGDHPALEGSGDTAAYMRFASPEDVSRQQSDLERLVRAWCEWRETPS